MTATESLPRQPMNARLCPDCAAEMIADQERPRLWHCIKCHGIWHSKPTEHDLAAMASLLRVGFVSELRTACQCAKASPTSNGQYRHKWGWDNVCKLCGRTNAEINDIRDKIIRTPKLPTL